MGAKGVFRCLRGADKAPPPGRFSPLSGEICPKGEAWRDGRPVPYGVAIGWCGVVGGDVLDARILRSASTSSVICCANATFPSRGRLWDGGPYGVAAGWGEVVGGDVLDARILRSASTSSDLAIARPPSPRGEGYGTAAPTNPIRSYRHTVGGRCPHPPAFCAPRPPHPSFAVQMPPSPRGEGYGTASPTELQRVGEGS